jgi:hypothetical protein
MKSGQKAETFCRRPVAFAATMITIIVLAASNCCKNVSAANYGGWICSQHSALEATHLK